MGRALPQEEGAMFLSPRTCLVCHEAKQENLKKCSGCPYATFCSAHPSSCSHDQVCSMINDKYEFQTRLSKLKLSTAAAIQAIVNSTTVHKSLKLPTSVADYLYRYAQTPVTIPEDVKIHTSIYFTKSLTLFNALQKLNYNPRLKMVVYIVAQFTPFHVSVYWEVLLHLLPKLINLKIILFEPPEDLKYTINVCEKCRSKKKTLTLEFVSTSFVEYVKSKSHTKADFVALYNYDPLQEENLFVNTSCKVVKNFDFITCPLLLTTVTEKKAMAASERLRSNLKNCEICYAGKNDFAPIKPEVDWETEGISIPNQFLMVMKPRES
ncbi:uncharacterized protein LOC117173888 [Belonocnema kinseyi]|uniref:uncharacterized protein LOC117173888 n=1 Tax=Belonocnema kinseyi TaxID=2817044 RepID=UPI00143CD9B6|nr:uncharacterized protein LOC117173888 [Belonocnema kinseyi]